MIVILCHALPSPQDLEYFQSFLRHLRQGHRPHQEHHPPQDCPGQLGEGPGNVCELNQNPLDIKHCFS